LPYTPQVVIISENKDTAVAFPAVTGGVCVEGGGFGGATAAALPWLVEAPLLVYWGDIDAAGYEILDGFRGDGVPAISMLMDLATFERYERYGTSLDRHGNPLGPGTRRDLPHLDTAERTMYHALTDPAWSRHWRIEQERIPLADALAALRLLQAREAVCAAPGLASDCCGSPSHQGRRNLVPVRVPSGGPAGDAEAL
jgi:hypothetical protein